MIHARIDTVDHRQIVGFETGTRTLFDARHGGDPLYVFLDSYRVLYRADFADFMLYPTTYKIDNLGDIIKTTDTPIIIIEEEPTVDAGYKALQGRDGRYLKNAYGEFIIGYDGTYSPPPTGWVYLVDEDQVFLTDPDGFFLIEPLGDVAPDSVLVDDQNRVLTEDDESILLTDA